MTYVVRGVLSVLLALLVWRVLSAMTSGEPVPFSMIAFAAVAVVAIATFEIGRRRSIAVSGGRQTMLHSLPSYHGYFTVIWTLLPVVGMLAIIAIAKPLYVDSAVTSEFPPEVAESGSDSGLIMGVVRNVAIGLTRLSEKEAEQLRIGLVPIGPTMAAKGVAISGTVEPYMVRAAEKLNRLEGVFFWLLWAAPIAAGIVGFVLATRMITTGLRARNRVENVVLWFFLASSTIAILTTLGIVLSLLFESINFFKQVPITSFLFGTTWDPRFAAADSSGSEGGQFGILPLVWGTMYISLIALLVAVPIGLFAAIYMSEYASRSVRSVAKPLLEILAGIPTIVYGFFALVTVGPLIRDWIAMPLGLGNSGTSVMTAGLVMGIMIIPFVSSLSDDIISAVPQSLRDGSLGIGATKSETIRKVVLPAALPGIVGAILLAASRAIGETMIVVLAAGVATNISLNPFAEMTTVTVKIVSQLTGDTEFTSPQTLVAFALGLALFIVTLGMNMFALYIVRKYREQYE